MAEIKLVKPDMLKARFQIGSIHGRTTYKREERVFHQSDVPAKSRKAREMVQSTLQPSTHLSNNRPWNIDTHGPYQSGKCVAPWDSGPMDDRMYKSSDAQQRVQKQKQRIETIRQGMDPDADPKAIHQTWNQSVTLLPPYKRKLQEKLAPSAKLLTKNVAVPPTRISLKARQTLLSQSITAQKRKQRQKEQRRLEQMGHIPPQLGDEGISTYQWPGNGRELDIQDIKKQLESTYNADTLQNFLMTQEKEMKQRPNSRTGTPNSTTRGFAMTNTPVKGRSRKEKTMGLGSTLKSTGRRSSRKLPPTIHYEHRGVWGHSPIEDAEVWSCCMSMDREGGGCTAKVITEPDRWNLASS